MTGPRLRSTRTCCCVLFPCAAVYPVAQVSPLDPRPTSEGTLERQAGRHDPKGRRVAVFQVMEVMPDHVHLPVEVAPRIGIHRLVKVFKCVACAPPAVLAGAQSSPTDYLSANAYFVASTGGAPLAAIKPYAEKQERV